MPLVPKAIKDVKGPKDNKGMQRHSPIPAAKEKAPKALRENSPRSPSPPAKHQRKVAFDDEPTRYCIKVIVDHYNFVTALLHTFQ